jgi:hypothetical protein
MIVYLLAAYGCFRVRKGMWRDPTNKFLLTRVFDSATFAGSVMLIIGIVEPAILLLIGNTKPFLIVGGIAGVVYSLHALFPD